MIKRPRIKVECTKDAVWAEINGIESSYHKANDWMNNAGAGVECQITLQNHAKTLCLYYYDIHQVY